MTRTLVATPDHEQCQARQRKPNGQVVPCPNEAEFDVITVCENGDEDTKLLCGGCMSNALSNKMNCRECRQQGRRVPVWVVAYMEMGVVDDAEDA